MNNSDSLICLYQAFTAFDYISIGMLDYKKKLENMSTGRIHFCIFSYFIH